MNAFTDNIVAILGNSIGWGVTGLLSIFTGAMVFLVIWLTGRGLLAAVGAGIAFSVTGFFVLCQLVGPLLTSDLLGSYADITAERLARLHDVDANKVPLLSAFGTITSAFAAIISASAATFTAAFAAVTLLKALVEYTNQNTIKRFEKFQEMSVRFDENPDIQKLCTLLRENSLSLRRIPKHKKEVLICFFEEIAIMQNSKIIRGDMGYYTFGYYATQCFNNDNFWYNLPEKTLYYELFYEFCRNCKRFEGKFARQKNRPKLHGIRA